MHDETTNVIAAFLRTAERLGERPAAHHKVEEGWRILSWRELAERIVRAAAGLKRLGIKPGERVLLFAQTRLEWMIADCAILAAGNVTVPLYHSLTEERLAEVIADSAPRLAFVEDRAFRSRFERARDRAGVGELPILTLVPDGGSDLETLWRGTRPEEGEAICEAAAAIDPQAVATIVYTSGTTGGLKGVVLTHRNLLAEIRGDQEVFLFGTDDICLLCLPLAHVLGRMTQFYCLVQGTQMAFAESIQRLAENYREIRPHFVVAVPRMLEKIHERVMAYLEGKGRFTQRLARWCIEVGLHRATCQMRHQPVPLGTTVGYWIGRLLLFRKLKERLGGRLRIAICGGAYLREEIAKFFHAAGILIQEGYGLTETFAAATVNRVDDFRFGTVGKPIPGVQMKISDEGEVLLRGETIFKEYLNKPAETEATFDENGWLRTGDLGEYTRDGFLRITGRKKDIIITAGGKNVAPQMIEALMGRSPYITHFIVVGEGRKYLTALVSLNHEAVREYLRGQGEEPEGALERHPGVRRLIGRHVEEVNRELAQYETIKRFAILDGELTMDAGELTPTFKMRRVAIMQRYRETIDALYRD